MAKRNWISVVIFGFTILAGCGKKAPPFAPITQAPQAQTQEALPEPEPLAVNVTCADDLCEPALALALTFETKASPTPTACSAVLVANDLVALPASCLPSDLRAAGKTCADRALFSFPKSIHTEAVLVGCSEIMEVQQSAQPNEADFAIVRVSGSTQRSALRLSHDGWADTTYTVWSLELTQPSPKTFQATFKKTSGNPAFKTALTPSSAKQNSAVMSVIRTDTLKSLPGAIALSATGELIGLLRNATLTKLPYDQFEKVFQPLAIGSNLGCSNALIGGATADSCQTIASGSIELFTQSLRESAYESFAPHLLKQSQTNFGDDIKTVFQWKTFVQNASGAAKKRVFIVPTCFQSEKLWSYKFKQFWGGFKSVTTITQEVPVYTVAEGLNRYYQPEVRMGNHHVSTVNLAIEFSPANFVRTKASEVIVYTESRTAPLEKTTLRACP